MKMRERLQKILTRLLPIMRLLLWIAAIFGSLLTFPSGLSWLIAGWLAVLGVLIAREKTAWPVLVTLLIVIIVKQPGWSAALIAFLVGGSLTLIGILRFQQKSQTLSAFFLLTGLFIWLAISRWQDANCSKVVPLKPDRPIVCLGDSLTDYGYPEELQKLTHNPIVDFGRDGYTTRDAIKRLLPEIEALRPQAVIVELGGHDFNLENRSRSATKASLTEIVERLQAIDAEVILVEIPRGFIRDPYAGLERELCRQFDLQLIPDTIIRQFVLWSPLFPPGSWVDPSLQCSSDALHPNDRGNRLFAQYAIEALVKVYGPEVAR